MVEGGVEGVEAVEFGFDLRSISEGEAQAAKDLNGAVLDDGERVEGSDGEFPGGHGDVEAIDGGFIGRVLLTLFTSLESGVDGLACGIECCAEFGFFLVGEVAHFSGEGIEGRFFAEEFDAGFFEGGFGGGCFDRGEGIGLDLGGLLGHGGGRLNGER